MTASKPNTLAALLTTQFLGAFNDNAWKMVAILLGTRVASDADRLAESSRQWTLAFVAFSVPYLILSLPAGSLADRVSKRTVLIVAKAVEMALMIAGLAVLVLAPNEPWLLLGILACMGAQSALLGPAKYGIVPELVPHSRLSSANGQIELWTFAAIVLGTAGGGVLLDLSETATDGVWLVGIALVVLAAVGLAASRRVPHVPAVGSREPLVATVHGAWNSIRSERILWLTVLGLTFYWGIISLVGQVIGIYVQNDLKATDAQAGLPLAIFGVGVGVGSLFAGHFSRGKVESGLIPFGALGLATTLVLMGNLPPESVSTMLPWAFAMGFASGLMIVPLNALLQWRSPENRRGAIIALSNVFVSVGIIAGSLSSNLLSAWGNTASSSILSAGVLTVIGSLWSLWILPSAFLRLLLLLLTNTLYRLKILGRANVPETGGALLVPNHVSFADGLFLIASVDRPIRFIVDANYFHHPVLKPFMKSLGAIPITAAGGPRVVLRALRDAGEYLEQGHLVCIFAEGQITRTGMLLPFRRGLERIVKGRNVPIIPVHLDGAWGSVFSRSGGRFLLKIPQRVPYPITVTFGETLDPGTRVADIRRSVHELSEVAWRSRTSERRPLHHSYIKRARRRPLRLIFADATKPKVTGFASLVGAIALARALRRHWPGSERVGILLPSSVAGALTNIAATMAGKTSVNLNFTTGQSSFESAIRQSGLKSVVTSRQMLEKVQLTIPEGVTTVWLEDVHKNIGVGAKLFAFMIAALAPTRVVERACGSEKKITGGDTVTIIFSSGSTGEPKGVMLTHANIDANVEGVAQVTRVNADDCLIGLLPLFHSFGYMALWFAANRRLATVFHPNPLDAGMVGELVHRYSVSLLIATPTFLQLYLRRCTPAQFGSLRLVLVGAEKLSDRLALAFEEQFGIRPVEGYGATECSPAITVSAGDYRAPGFFQPGSRRGSVGQPLPGVAVRIVNPDSREELPFGEAGLILVKGPNVMQGYLGRDDLTEEAMKDGWYVTGDIGVMDEDGFLRITDRLSRFSKIGGEMVPHGRVEAALQEAAGEDMQVFAVTSIVDDRKGEKLIVLHTLDEDRIPKIVEQLAQAGLPNLFVPRPDQFLKVETLPVLGTGKLDLRAIKTIAEEAFAPSTAAGDR